MRGGEGGGGLLPTVYCTKRLLLKRIPYFRLKVYRMVGISRAGIYKRARKTAI